MQEELEVTINQISRFPDVVSLKSFIEWENSVIISSLYKKDPKISSGYELLNDSIFSILKNSSIDSLILICLLAGPDLQILKTEGTLESSTIKQGDSITRSWLVKSKIQFVALCIEGEYEGQYLIPSQVSSSEYSICFQATPSVASIPSIYTLAFKTLTEQGRVFGPELRMSVIIN